MQREFSEARQPQCLKATRSLTGCGDQPGPNVWPVALPAAAMVKVGKVPHLSPRPSGGDSLGDRCRHNTVLIADKMNLRNQADADIVRRVKRVAQRFVAMMQSPRAHIQQTGNGDHGDGLVQPRGDQQGERAAAAVADKDGAPQRIQGGLKSGDHAEDNLFGEAGGGPPPGITVLARVREVTGPRYIKDRGGCLFHQGESQCVMGRWIGADLATIRGPGSPVTLDEYNLGAGLLPVEHSYGKLACDSLEFLQLKAGSSLFERERMSSTGGEKNR